ncbi:hypothetical protein WCLP8_5210022 [uncultured Gammaproteobacteria bacterium]
MRQAAHFHIIYIVAAVIGTMVNVSYARAEEPADISVSASVQPADAPGGAAAGGWVLRLGHVKDEPAAHEMWREFRQRHPDLVSPELVAVIYDDPRGRNRLALAVSGVAPEEMKTACTKLRRAGDKCQRLRIGGRVAKILVEPAPPIAEGGTVETVPLAVGGVAEAVVAEAVVDPVPVPTTSANSLSANSLSVEPAQVEAVGTIEAPAVAVAADLGERPVQDTEIGQDTLPVAPVAPVEAAVVVVAESPVVVSEPVSPPESAAVAPPVPTQVSPAMVESELVSTMPETQPPPAPVPAASLVVAEEGPGQAAVLPSIDGPAVRLGLFTKERTAWRSWRRLARENPELFKGVVPVVYQPPRDETGGRARQVLAVRGDDDAALLRICERLKRQTEDCGPIRLASGLGHTVDPSERERNSVAEHAEKKAREGVHDVLPVIPNATTPRADHTTPRADHIVISVADRKLYYTTPDGRELSFPVGIGRHASLIVFGETEVVRKRRHPAWRPTPDMRRRDPTLPSVVGPGPHNPMGLYALDLGWAYIRIHGTNKPESVGHASSSGCYRMLASDIRELFSMVDVGTRVKVVPGRVQDGATVPAEAPARTGG